MEKKVTGELVRLSALQLRRMNISEARAKELKIRRIFALTTRAQHWFLTQGFKETGVAVLPEKRQALYNWKRNSKIFLKRL